MRFFTSSGVMALALPAEPQRQQVEGHDLGGEGLGGGDPDLRARVGIERPGGFPRQGGADHVGDGQDGAALQLGGLDGAQGVGGLSGLGDRHQESLGAHHGVAVPELGRRGRSPTGIRASCSIIVRPSMAA